MTPEQPFLLALDFTGTFAFALYGALTAVPGKPSASPGRFEVSQHGRRARLTLHELSQ